MIMNRCDLLAEVGAYYTTCLAQFGATPRGVDWNSAESQCLRFEQLLCRCDLARLCVLGDYGCGYAALLDFLLERGFAGEYRGFDIATRMIDTAYARHIGDARARFSTDEAVLQGSDFILASGIFNVKLQTPQPDWEACMEATLDRIAGHARGGFAFNMLTAYSDPEKRRPDLYYADPCRLFDFCKRRYSPHVSLLHDYGLFEFTIIVQR